MPLPYSSLTLNLTTAGLWALGLLSAVFGLLPCSALHPFLATIIGELTLCRAWANILGHLMSAQQQRTAGLHNALLSALLIARFLSLVSAPSRGAR
jgi:hypothetical protein